MSRLRAHREICHHDNHDQKHDADGPEKKLERRLGNKDFAGFACFCHGSGTVWEPFCSEQGSKLNKIDRRKQQCCSAMSYSRILNRNNKSLPAVEFNNSDVMERSLARVVLVVDDEPLVLEVTETMLKDLGCEVVTATGANEALEMLSTDERIEILITDINMPDMDGYELARAAVRMRKRLKVIMLSGREREGREFPLIRKPFLQQDLVETMKSTTGLC